MITVDEARSLAKKHKFKLVSQNNMSTVQPNQGCIVELLLADKGTNPTEFIPWEQTYFQWASSKLELPEEEVTQLSHGFEAITEANKLIVGPDTPQNLHPNPDHPTWQAGFAIRQQLATQHMEKTGE